jgi:Cu+-exporting ATPase
MHPEVVQPGPGACPNCGMGLEPHTLSANEPLDAELGDMTRRLWLSLVLSVPLMAAAMAEMVTELGEVSAQMLPWGQLAFASPVLLWGGAPFFVRGWRSLVTMRLNMFTLIAIGTGAAYVFSLLGVFIPERFPEAFRDGGKVAIYLESAAFIVTLVLLGQVLELRARRRTRGAIRALLDLAPKTARRIGADGAEVDVPLALVESGDRLRVRPGESVPADGTVLEGTSIVDESMMTGEATPIAKTAGDAVTAGTVNERGGLVMRADRVGSDTVLQRIVRLVVEAQRGRAPIQGITDTVAGYFVPAVLAISVATFLAWALWGPPPALAHGLVNAVAVLIIACPCALGLATPMSIMVGTGRGAQLGVLFRDAAALERLGAVDTVVLDKTGTLTEGEPRLVTIDAVAGHEKAAVLGLAASLETGSEHPLAGAIVAAAAARGLNLADVTDFRAVPGAGVIGRIGERTVAIGNRRLLTKSAIEAGDHNAQADSLRAQGQTVMSVAADGAVIGLLGMTDPIRESTPRALAALRAGGLRLVMLTGDHRATADVVARTLGLDEVFADVSPAEKMAIVNRLRAEGRIVAMVGDGINDSPALAAADVGIAMGSGADVAVERAGITLLRGDLGGLVQARRLSRMVMRNVRQNLFFAFAYNVLGVPIAAGVLFPWFGLLLSPVIAAAAMSLSSVSVIGNALRLQRQRI